jgi:uncharacterized protein
MRIINSTKNIELANDAQMAGSFFRRTLGLMFRRAMAKRSALILKPCNSIHTCFMRFSIDVVFVGMDGSVVGFESGIKPWRLSRVYWKARSCIEFASGSLPESSLSVGDKIILQE